MIFDITHSYLEVFYVINQIVVMVNVYFLYLHIAVYEWLKLAFNLSKCR